MYNLKIIEYPNGSIQIRKYSFPIGKLIDNEFIEEIEKEPIYEPFEGNEVKELNSLLTKTDVEENRRKSLSRTKQKINFYGRCYIWEWFITLTFDPSKCDRTNFNQCMKRIRNWLQNLRQKFAPNLKYLCVPELHSDLTSWHAHILLADTGNIKFTDSGHCDPNTAASIFNLPQWRFGFSTATRITSTHRVTTYIMKYVTKESMFLAKNAHKYYVSNNLPRPKESLMLAEPYEIDEIIQQIAESLGKEIAYCSKPYSTPYTDVTYIELE